MSQNPHGDRGHARWSASSTARNWACSGALALNRTAPPQKESIHAATGTAVHQIAERCLRDGGDANRFLDTVEKTKEREIEITEELVNSAQMYIDYVRSRVAAGGELQIEQYFSLNELGTLFDSGGTGDAILWFEDLKEIEIVDLKNGMGIVEIEANKQARSYGLGCALANPHRDIQKIRCTVVQPRAPHKDGAIRSEVFTFGELIEWTHELLEAQKRSKQAEIELDAIDGNDQKAVKAWADKWLKVGNCYFCPSSGPCPAQRQFTREKAKMWADDEGVERIEARPADMTPEEISATLDALPLIEEWVKAMRGFAHAQAERGTKIPEYQLSDKHGFRKWAIDDEEKLVADLMKVTGLTFAEVHTDPKVCSPAQIEKLLPKPQHDKISSMWIKPVTGTNLVRTTKTTRPPAKSKAASFAEETEEQ